MRSLRNFRIGSNRLNSKIPSSFWSLKDILNLFSNALIGNLPMEISKLRADVQLDLSGNQISSNIPETIGSLTTLQTLSLARNKLNGTIPTSLGEMVSLSFLDLSNNLLTGEIPDGEHFKNLTAQSFMHNEALCGNPLLQSKILTGTLATIGYVAPEYGSKGIVSVKGDVHKKEAYR
ncbi:receptor kinase protein Xa21 [Trifolium repens]|nr:receptor kinase protein Xa21 [Trifolium repens]